MGRTSSQAKTASVALIFVDHRVEHTIEQDRILHAGLFAGEAYHTVVCHAPFRLDAHAGIDPLAAVTALNAEDIRLAYFGTRFTKGTTVDREIERRHSVTVEDDDLLFTGSDACFGCACHTLTLKKRFIQSIRGAHHQGCFLVWGRCPEGRSEGSEEISP